MLHMHACIDVDEILSTYGDANYSGWCMYSLGEMPAGIKITNQIETLSKIILESEYYVFVWWGTGSVL